MRGTCPTAYSPETTTTAGIYTCRYSVDQTGLSLAMPTGGMASSIPTGTGRRSATAGYGPRAGRLAGGECGDHPEWKWRGCRIRVIDPGARRPIRRGPTASQRSMPRSWWPTAPRIWAYSGNGTPSAELSGNRRQALQSKYQAAQRRFNFPDGETHTWAYWRAPLQAMLPDLQRVLGDGQRPRRGPRPRERRPASPSL